MDSGRRRVLATDAEGSLEEQLSAAMTYSKYEQLLLAVAALDDFIACVGDVTADKEPAEKSAVSGLAQLARA
jgi:hypothetical protein